MDLTIGDVADRTGLTQRTLRYYEELGLLEPDRGTPAAGGGTTPRRSTGSTGSGSSATSARRWRTSTRTASTSSG